MPTAFQAELRKRIESIQQQDRMKTGIPEFFGVVCDMNTDQLSALQSVIGLRNDRPYCGAEPGCLTVVRRLRRGGASSSVAGRYSVMVTFAIDGAPPAEFDFAAVRPAPLSPNARPSPGRRAADFAARLP